MAVFQQHKDDKVDNQPLATLPFLDLSFSHSDASISRKSHLVTIRQLAIHGNVGTSFWWSGCPSSHQPAQIREETLESGNLFSGSWISASVPPYHHLFWKLSPLLHQELGLELCPILYHSKHLCSLPISAWNQADPCHVLPHTLITGLLAFSPTSPTQPPYLWKLIPSHLHALLKMPKLIYLFISVMSHHIGYTRIFKRL